ETLHLVRRPRLARDAPGVEVVGDLVGRLAGQEPLGRFDDDRRLLRVRDLTDERAGLRVVLAHIAVENLAVRTPGSRVRSRRPEDAAPGPFGLVLGDQRVKPGPEGVARIIEVEATSRVVELHAMRPAEVPKLDELAEVAVVAGRLPRDEHVDPVR